MLKLENKVAIVTGAMRGIGLAVAENFIKEGAKVMLLDVDEKKLEKAVAHLNTEQVLWKKADVTKHEEVKAAVIATVEQWNKLDIVCCNAGIGGTAHVTWEYPEEDFDKVINVNLKGVWLSMKHTIPEMIKIGGGSIIIISSLAGLRGATKAVAYTASKHAVTGIMKTTALEAARYNIRVNSIHPGPVETEMVRGLECTICPSNIEEARKTLLKAIPLRRYANTADIAKLAVFLASDEASYITGSEHTIDGGMNA
ncbi:MAG: SDR family NAD(P)-dependent oxidoreductase [Bacteroidota bacterium]